MSIRTQNNRKQRQLDRNRTPYEVFLMILNAKYKSVSVSGYCVYRGKRLVWKADKYIR